jgi:hypothetical protein
MGRGPGPGRQALSMRIDHGPHRTRRASRTRRIRAVVTAAARRSTGLAAATARSDRASPRDGRPGRRTRRSRGPDPAAPVASGVGPGPARSPVTRDRVEELVRPIGPRERPGVGGSTREKIVAHEGPRSRRPRPGEVEGRGTRAPGRTPRSVPRGRRRGRRGDGRRRGQHPRPGGAVAGPAAGAPRSRRRGGTTRRARGRHSTYSASWTHGDAAERSTSISSQASDQHAA